MWSNLWLTDGLTWTSCKLTRGDHFQQGCALEVPGFHSWLPFALSWLEKFTFSYKLRCWIPRTSWLGTFRLCSGCHFNLKMHFCPQQVCREYQRGACSREECRYAHPPRHVSVDSSDNMITVCMDFMKGRCQREMCRYFHPPAHLQGRVRAAQQQSLPVSYTSLGFHSQMQTVYQLKQRKLQ